MSNSIREVQRFVGLDVHAETIAVAVAEKDGEVRTLGIIPNRPESVCKLLPKLGPRGSWLACYEAGPTGYTRYWQLTQAGVPCVVVAPTLVPMRISDRVKTGDSSTRAPLAIPSGVDPQFLLRYGATGLWILFVSILGLKSRNIPNLLGVVGMLATAMYWLLAASDLIGMAGILRTIVAIAGGVVAGPIWYIWVGVRLLKTSA